MATEVSESQDGSVRERRLAARQRALLTGHVAYGAGASSLKCTIRDISESGARIAIPESCTTPLSMCLIDVRNGVAFDALVKWRSQNEIGLAFRTRYQIEGALLAELRFLHHLWNELRVR